MWSIVNFTDDNSVTAVPSHWWKNGFCAWPKKSTKNATLLLERRSIPNKFDYDFFKARKIYTKNPIKSYIDAKNKAKKAQLTSDLSSAEESQSNNRFNNKLIKSTSPPVFSDNDEEIVNNATQPIIDKKKQTMKFSRHVLSAGNDNHDNFSTRAYKNKSNNHANTTIIKRNQNIKSTEPQILSDESDQNIDDEDNSDIDRTYEPSNLDKNKMNEELDIIKSPSGFWKVSTAKVTDDTQILNNGQTPAGMNKVKKRLFMSEGGMDIEKLKSQPKVSRFDDEFIKTSLTNLKYDIKHLSYVTESNKKMLENINNILEQGVTRNTDLTDINVLVNNENIPISNDETLQHFELFLENPTHRDKVVLELSLLVGKTIPETVRRMMQKLFKDNWLRNYSYIGFKGKNKFSTLRSCKIIFDAVWRSKFKDIPEMEIALTISKWMAQAPNRLKKNKDNVDKETL